MKMIWFPILILSKLSEIGSMNLPDDGFEFPATTITNQVTTDELETMPKGNRYAFFRNIEAGLPPGSESRRIFGGASADLKDFKAVCALLDRYWAVRCTATVLTPHWVVTAAHCITSRIAYVKYNTQRPASVDGNVTAVHFLYRHPKYNVVQKDEGRGMDVVALHHDVGLARTRDRMQLRNADAVFSSLRSTNALDLYNKEIKVLGFGRTERSILGEELFSVELVLVPCERDNWIHCICGVAREAPRGVCSGDSGGPVLYQGSLIGITSMGPVECAQNSGSPASGTTSVFTSLHQYADLINTTILDTEAALRMRIISHATGSCGSCLTLLCLCYTVILMFPMR